MSRVLRADHSQVLNGLLLKGPFDAGAVLGKSNGFSNIAQLVVRPSEVKQGRRGEPGVGFQIGQRGPNRFVGFRGAQGCSGSVMIIMHRRLWGPNRLIEQPFSG